MYQLENFLVDVTMSIYIKCQEFICSYAAKNDEKPKQLA